MRYQNSSNFKRSNNVRIKNEVKQIAKSINPSSQRVNGPINPKPVTSDLILTKIFRKVASVSMASPLTIDPAFIQDCIPGGASTFDRFRIEKISVYGPSNVSSGDLPSVILTINDDQATFSDQGVLGQQRAVLHIRPAFESRMSWRSSTGGTIATVATDVTNSNDFIIDITVTLRSVTQGCPN